MNKRTRKKNEKQGASSCRILLHEILNLVLDINGDGGRRADMPDNPGDTVLLDFFGNSGNLAVKVYKGGFSAKAKPEIDLKVSIKDKKALGDMISVLEDVMEEK